MRSSSAILPGPTDPCDPRSTRKRTVVLDMTASAPDSTALARSCASRVLTSARLPLYIAAYKGVLLMTDEASTGRSSLRTVALLAGTGIGVLQLNGVYAAESAADTPPIRDALEQVTVFGQKDADKLDKSGLPKL